MVKVKVVLRRRQVGGSLHVKGRVAVMGVDKWC